MEKDFVVPAFDEHIRVIDFEESASHVLSPAIWNYLQTGAGAGSATSENRKIWDKYHLVPRILAGVSKPETQVHILGREWVHPIALAPIAAHGVFHKGAENESAAGSNAAKSTLIVSTHGSLGVKEFGSNQKEPWWFQLYIHRDRSVTTRLIREAHQYGAEAIVLTIDTPVAGYRDQDRKSFVGSPKRLTPGQPDSIYPNLFDLERFDDQLPRHRKVLDPVLDPKITWEDIDWLLSISKLPIIVKGVLHPLDAVRLSKYGISGLVVSNHGGRNLDGGTNALRQLQAIRGALGKEFLILYDGGITRGSEICKAITLGADAVLIGRPYIWGLSTFGSAGVQRVIEILQTELETTMILCGAQDLKFLAGQTLTSDL
jgi:4-hydroxymandelate oxidase